jgi:hypothetical protein
MSTLINKKCVWRILIDTHLGYVPAMAGWPTHEISSLVGENMTIVEGNAGQTSLLKGGINGRRTRTLDEEG